MVLLEVCIRVFGSYLCGCLSVFLVRRVGLFCPCAPVACDVFLLLSLGEKPEGFLLLFLVPERLICCSARSSLIHVEVSGLDMMGCDVCHPGRLYSCPPELVSCRLLGHHS